MPSSIRLGAISLDSDDPAALAQFYRELLGLTPTWQSEDFVALKGAGVLLTIQRDSDLRRTTWPDGPVPKQMHLELAVDDLDVAEHRAIALGATKAEHQPQPDRWRVLIDRDGHPFCVTTLIPDA
ncbi:VOC family protein [Lapillicoccus sp.]|uniref:VOC family protein n=1 Tax=Lapillicoccus sp. TaxID=1909287 RepID=UPI003264349C